MPEKINQTVLAKSRLKKNTSTIIEEKLLLKNKSNEANFVYFKKYLSKIPSLCIGLFFLFLLVVFLNTVQPSQVQNFLFQNSFLPFLLLVGISLFFISSFLLLNSRRGLFISVGVTLLLWVKLTNSENILLVIGTAAVLFAWFSFFEIILIKIKHKQSI